MIFSDSWVVSEPSDLPLLQVISLLSYSYNGELYGRLKIYSHLKEMIISSSFQQVSKKVYTSQGKLEQFFKSTRRKTCPFQNEHGLYQSWLYLFRTMCRSCRWSYLELGLQFVFPGKWPTYCFDQIKFQHLFRSGNFQAFKYEILNSTSTCKDTEERNPFILSAHPISRACQEPVLLLLEFSL